MVNNDSYDQVLLSEGLDNSNVMQPAQYYYQGYDQPYQQQYFANLPNRNSQEFNTSRFSAV